MIEILEGFPGGVVAVTAKGRVTKQDYDDVLIPKLREVLSRRGKIRLYYELGEGFSGIDPGAAWEDFTLGMRYLRRWERVAVVTDVDWIRIAIGVFRFLVPGEIRVFGTSQALDARNWIAATAPE
jgi:hypothetical protein